jgi:hypothetical protein
MGKFVFSNACLYLEKSSTASTLSASTTGVDYLSSYLKSLTLNFSKSEVDKTCMLDEGIGRLSGLYDWSMDLEFAQDCANDLLDEILFNSINTNKTSLGIRFRPTTAAVGATNPQYTGKGMIFEYTPLTGSVGDLSTASVSIRAVAASSAASTAWLKRATA